MAVRGAHITVEIVQRSRQLRVAELHQQAKAQRAGRAVHHQELTRVVVQAVVAVLDIAVAYQAAVVARVGIRVTVGRAVIKARTRAQTQARALRVLVVVVVVVLRATLAAVVVV